MAIVKKNNCYHLQKFSAIIFNSLYLDDSYACHIALIDITIFHRCTFLFSTRY